MKFSQSVLLKMMALGIGVVGFSGTAVAMLAKGTAPTVSIILYAHPAWCNIGVIKATIQARIAGQGALEFQIVPSNIASLGVAFADNVAAEAAVLKDNINEARARGLDTHVITFDDVGELVAASTSHILDPVSGTAAGAGGLVTAITGALTQTSSIVSAEATHYVNTKISSTSGSSIPVFSRISNAALGAVQALGSAFGGKIMNYASAQAASAAQSAAGSALNAVPGGSLVGMLAGTSFGQALGAALAEKVENAAASAVARVTGFNLKLCVVHVIHETAPKIKIPWDVKGATLNEYKLYDADYVPGWSCCGKSSTPMDELAGTCVKSVIDTAVMAVTKS